MKKLILLTVLLLIAVTSNAQQNIESPIHQLRIYEINPENREVFHVRFRDEAHRIMKKYDFKIVSIWETTFEDKLEYVYLLEWPDEESMKKAWEGFMADQEWKDIKKKTSAKYGSFVYNIEDRPLKIMNYSPNKALQNKD